MAEISHPDETGKLAGRATGAATGRRWRWLLVLPYLGLCFPSLYARSTPALWGFPFFYWYQFAWVIVASGLIGFVYWTHRD